MIKFSLKASPSEMINIISIATAVPIAPMTSFRAETIKPPITPLFAPEVLSA